MLYLYHEKSCILSLFGVVVVSLSYLFAVFFSDPQPQADCQPKKNEHLTKERVENNLRIFSHAVSVCYRAFTRLGNTNRRLQRGFA